MIQCLEKIILREYVNNKIDSTGVKSLPKCKVSMFKITKLLVNKLIM